MLFKDTDSDNTDIDPKPGLYGYAHTNGEDRVQVHLRVHNDQSGLLLINAQRAFHLNTTATFMAWLQLEGVSHTIAVHAIRKRYRVNKKTALQDFTNIQTMLEQVTNPNGACPVCDLELDLLPPFSEIPAAPYRMDLAITYRCNANCAHCYNARPRNYAELDTAAWREIIDRLYAIGIPHICFTGGEATMRDDLPQLIARVTANGQIAGLLTNGRRLSDTAFAEALVRAGLDHVQITLESHDDGVHDQMVAARTAWRETVAGIRNALAAGLYVTTNTTLTRHNVPTIEETVAFIGSLGVPTFACNSIIYSGRGATVGTGFEEGELVPVLERVREAADRHGLRLIWYTPTQYCALSPLQLGLGVKACTAALYNMCVEPDGAVIPCQSYYEPLGHMLLDPWESIWNHELAASLRERRYAPEKCRECPELSLCGGGCPLYLEHRTQ